jgi:hypothetical protein
MTKYFSTIPLFILIGVIVAFGYSIWKKEKTIVVNKIIPQKQEEQFSIDVPPKQSKVGVVESISGNEILFQSRIASMPVKMTEIKQIQQAELLSLGKETSSKILFKDAVSIDMSQESEIEFLQTLPINFVFRQNKGKIIYEKLGSIPISIRSRFLLTSIIEGKTSIDTDIETHIITLTVLEGSVKVAYNDIDYKTQTQIIEKGKVFIFNDDLREGTLEDLQE